MVEEYSSTMRNDVWEIIPRLEGNSMLNCQWIFKIKDIVDGSVEKYKSRFVARWFSQKEKVGYEETFYPIAKYASIRELKYISSYMWWRIHQTDVKTTFLDGVTDEGMYTEYPQGFQVYGKDYHACRLNKALYKLM